MEILSGSTQFHVEEDKLISKFVSISSLTAKTFRLGMQGNINFSILNIDIFAKV